MSTRRTHCKTRRGCYECKKRHIKCDQQGPPCANCQVRGLDCCQLIPDSASRSRQVARATAPVPLEAKNLGTTGSNSGQARLLEIELIHHWSVSTYQDFNLVVNDREFWQMVLPQDALAHEFLLDAVLAVTAIHMAVTAAPERSSVYHTAALQYQNSAIAEFKAKALPVRSSNHRALFAFSLIMLALGFAVPRFSPQDQNAKTVFAHLKTVFSLLEGTTSIYRTSQAWLHGSPFAVITQKYRDKTSVKNLEDDVSDALDQLRALNDVDYSSASPSISDSLPDRVIRHENNLKAITWLEECFVTDPNEETLRCLTWLATLEPEFMRCVELGEPFALLVTMHWAVLLHRCGMDRWWARSSGKILITELYTALGSRRTDWSSQIAWVCGQVGLPMFV